MSSGEGTGTTYETLRAHDYPVIRQFTVFLENRVGQLLEVVRRFEGSQVQIVALSIADSSEYAVVRFLLNDPDEGREILERAGLSIVESDLIGIEMPETSQPLIKVCTTLLQAEVNVKQIYPLLVWPHGRPVVALMVDNIEMAIKTLKTAGIQTIDEGDLRKME